MKTETRCSKCGDPVRREVVGGFCTACLLEEGLSPAKLAQNPIALRYFGDYELIEEIARGGMGVVFKARQRSLNRLVAVKMILSGHLASEGQAQRFRAEARAAAALQHPGIVAIHEVGEHEGLLFFSMAYVAGQNLAQLVRDGPWPATQAAQCVREIAGAIQYAHEQGVLHRDLKPSNVLIDANGQPHVTDFGLAKQLNTDAQLSTNDPHLTLSGQILGSPNFMPPEQAAGKHGGLTPAADVYSLGAILYHCLTGRPPFVAETLTQTLRMVADQEPVSPRLLNASVPRDLETICLKCLEKDPRRRYAAAQELADELGRFLRSEPIQARPAGVVLKIHRWCVRNKPLAISGTAILALLLVVAIGSPIAAIRINRERTHAEANAKQASSEAIKSQQVSKFLKGMLLGAGPSVARGRDATIVREILEAASTRVSSELKDQPQVQGDMYSTIGNTFVDIGDHRRAITNFEQAVTSYHLAFQGDHQNLALTLSALGFCQSFTDDIARGNNNARLGVEMARRCGDPGILFTCLWQYAGSFRGWGMFPAESEPYVREAYELKKKMGNDPVGLATAQHLYSGFLTNTEDNEQMLRDALDLFRKHLPPEHPQTIQGVFSLGQRLVNSGKYAVAEPVMLEALQGFHKIHAATHPYQSIVLRYLIYALIGQGKLKEAEALLYEHAETFPANLNYHLMLVRFRMQHGSPNGATEPLPRDLQAKLEQGEFSPNWAVSLLHVGAYEKYQEYRRQFLDAAFARNDFRGKLDVAKVLLLSDGNNQDVEQACRFAELAIANASDVDRYYHLEELNSLLELRRGRFSVAKACATRHVAKGEESKPRLCEGYFITALACVQLNQPNAARLALAKGGELMTPHLPEGTEAYLFMGDEWILARYLGNEAKKAIASLPASVDPANVRVEEPAEAIDLALESEKQAEDILRYQLSVWKDSQQTNDLSTADVFISLAERLARRGRSDEAATFSRQAFEIQQRLAGTNLSLLVGTLGRLCGLLDQAQKYSEAERFLQQRLAMLREISGSNSRQVAGDLGWLAVVFSKDRKYAEAEPLLREKLAIEKQVFGLEHTNTLGTTEWLANNLADRKEWSQCEVARRDLVSGRRKVFGDTHPETLRALTELHYALVQQGKRAETESVARELAVAQPKDQSPDYGRTGKWKEAAAGMAKALEAEPGNHLPYHLLAPLLVASGDAEGYRRHCEKIQVQFAGIQEPLVCERMAKACLILPGDNVDFEQINQWVKTTLTADRNSSLFRYAQFASGLAAYRQGNHTQALESARTVLGLPGADPHPELASWAVIAMAKHGLKQTTEAVTALSKGRELAKAKLPKLEAGDLGTGWNDWIITQALLREASALIEGTPPDANVFIPIGRRPEAALELAAASELTPTNHLFFRTRGDVLGRAGQWKEAAASLRQSIELEPDDPWPYLRLAPILLLTGDEAGYRQLCQQIVTRFSGTKDLATADMVAKTCSLHPQSGADLQVVAAAAETAVTLGKQNEYFPWFALCKSMAEYRQEHYADAADWAKRSLAVPWHMPSKDATAHIVLAMAQMKLNRPAAARNSFDQGVNLVDNKLPKLASGDLGFEWENVIIANILLREARELIEPNGPLRAPVPKVAQP